MAAPQDDFLTSLRSRRADKRGPEGPMRADKAPARRRAEERPTGGRRRAAQPAAEPVY